MTVRILTGDVRDRLADLPDGSVQCVVTSPPYFGLRDYGTAGQIGLEPTLAEYVQTMVQVFRDVRRVLRDDGVCFINLGDSYAGGKTGRDDNSAVDRARMDAHGHGGGVKLQAAGNNGVPRKPTDGLKPKDLMMVPARVALALQDDGWWLRSDIIWAKRNCMPESVVDRPTSSHEHIFLLTKQARYFYDAEAVKEESQPSSIDRQRNGWNGNEDRGWVNGKQNNLSKYIGTDRGMELALVGRNQRNVWHLATEPFPEAHFATFPTEIPRRCIKAGTSEKGQCPACGAPWTRVVDAERTNYSSRPDLPAKTNGALSGGVGKNFPDLRVTTTGWSPSCTCNAGGPVPQTVLDPFMGAGTTLLVADQLGRHGIGIELNPAYAEMARKRIYNDAPMFAELVAD